MSDESKSFKIVDKRGFSPAGETEKAPPAEEPKHEESPRLDDHRQEAKLPPVDFNWLIVSFATQAMVLLGQVPDPQTHQTIVNIEGAKHTIDILGLLEEKTKGNLSEEEQKLLEDVLADLRLTYVKRLREHPRQGH